MPNTIQLFKKQIEFFNLTDREALLEAGIGFGKSRVASLWLATQTQRYHHSKWIMAARDYRQLKTAVDEEFEYVLRDVLGLERRIHYEKTNGSPIEYTFKNGSKIYGMSAVNYDTNFRGGSYSGAWADEVDYYKPDAIKALRGRIRVFPELIRFTSSPYGFNHIHKDFHVNKIGPVVHATTYDNPTLSKEYIENLKESYSERLFRQEVLAERINITEGSVYFAFNRELNVKPVSLPPRTPIWIGMDFNVHPMTAAIMFIKGQTAYVFDEIYIDRQSSTDEVAKLIAQKYGVNGVTIVPDSTGKKSTTNANASDIQILKSHGFAIQSAHNPFRIDRYNCVNSLLEKGRVIIDPKCRYLIKDLEQVSFKEGTNQVSNADPMLTHISDALGYALYRTINPFKNKIKPIIME